MISELQIDEIREIQFVIVADAKKISIVETKIKLSDKDPMHIGVIPLSPNYSKKISNPDRDIYTHYVTVRRQSQNKQQLLRAFTLIKNTSEVKLISIKFI